MIVSEGNALFSSESKFSGSTFFQRYTHHIYHAWGGILHRHHRQLTNPRQFTRSHWSSWEQFLASPPHGKKHICQSSGPGLESRPGTTGKPECEFLPVSPRCCVVPWWVHFRIFFLLAQDISTDSGSYILYPSLLFVATMIDPWHLMDSWD